MPYRKFDIRATARAEITASSPRQAVLLQSHRHLLLECPDPAGKKVYLADLTNKHLELQKTLGDAVARLPPIR